VIWILCQQRTTSQSIFYIFLDNLKFSISVLCPFVRHAESLFTSSRARNSTLGCQGSLTKKNGANPVEHASDLQMSPYHSTYTQYSILEIASRQKIPPMNQAQATIEARPLAIRRHHYFIEDHPVVDIHYGARGTRQRSCRAAEAKRQPSRR
jgi:hypothetical protein